MIPRATPHQRAGAILVALATALVASLSLAAAQELTFTLQGDAIAGPATTDLNGFVKIVFVNDTDRNHDMSLDHLHDGVTYETFLPLAEAVSDATGDPGDFAAAIADWLAAADAIGGVTVPAHGQAYAYLRLQPGSYVVEAVLVEDGTEPGDAPTLYGRFEVTPGPTLAAPATDLTVHMTDFHFDFPDVVSAGAQLWEVIDAGSQPHIGVIFRLADGSSLEDFQSWMESASPDSGPPPAEPISVLLPLTAGQTMIVPIDLAPGDYAVVCFLPDLASGAPHFALGMIDGFRVQ